MQLKIRNLKIDNFKGCKHLNIDFSEFVTSISGANATGKTTILDGLWWLLFGKDSTGSEKFEIRPLDADGNKVHHVDISVEATCEVIYDDAATVLKETVIIKKRQSEKWVTKRGSVSAELQGNVNTYEVDGFERKESEYKAFIAKLIEEKLFKMLTSPMYFASLPWKEQREILMQFVADKTDRELAEEFGGFDLILDDLGKASTDDVAAKYRKEQTGLKKEQAEAPVRIDEVSKRKVDVNVPLLMKERAAIVEQIEELDEHIKSIDVSAQAKNIADQIYGLKTQQTEMLRKSREQFETEKHETKMQLMSLQSQAQVLSSRMAEKKREIDRADKTIEADNSMLANFRKQWTETKAEEYKGDDVCFNCGQPLPENMVAKNKAKFEADKAARLEQITEKAKLISDDAKRVTADREKAVKDLTDFEIGKNSADRGIKALEEKLNALVEPPIPAECYELDDQIIALEKTAETLVQPDTTDYEIARDTFQKRVNEIDMALAQVKENEAIDARVAELTEELRNIAQRSADVEQKIDLLEQFVRMKMERVSKIVNGYFDGVEFKLFDTQINGGVKETCECTVNGVPYGSLNNGHRIIAGIAIIKALQKQFNVSAPVFLDNAEALSSFNIPKLDCQLVTMSVSDEPTLTVR